MGKLNQFRGGIELKIHKQIEKTKGNLYSKNTQLSYYFNHDNKILVFCKEFSFQKKLFLRLNY